MDRKRIINRSQDFLPAEDPRSFSQMKMNFSLTEEPKFVT